MLKKLQFGIGQLFIAGVIAGVMSTLIVIAFGFDPFWIGPATMIIGTCLLVGTAPIIPE